jgi:hypothetical protein
MNEKKWYASKTMWFNIAFGVLTVGTAVLNYFGYSDFEPTGEVTMLVGALVAIVNIILRLVTSKKLTL